MPILRIDVPEGLTREQKATLQKASRAIPIVVVGINL